MSIRGWLQVLTQVYPDPRNVDDELVESIRVPSLDPNAPEVLYSIDYVIITEAHVQCTAVASFFA